MEAQVWRHGLRPSGPSQKEAQCREKSAGRARCGGVRGEGGPCPRTGTPSLPLTSAYKWISEN